MMSCDTMLKVDSLISKRELIDFIEISSNEFKPPLSYRMKIDDYCKKLIDKASLFITRENDVVVGIAAFYCNDQTEKQAYLSYIYVRPKKRNQGFGQMLLRKAIMHSQKCGMNSMKLETWHDNRAISLYRRHGFRQVGEKNIHGVSTVIMVARFDEILPKLFGFFRANQPAGYTFLTTSIS